LKPYKSFSSSARSNGYSSYQRSASSRHPGFRQTASGNWVERDEWEPNEDHWTTPVINGAWRS
jgi:hypothetical protein